MIDKFDYVKDATEVFMCYLEIHNIDFNKLELHEKFYLFGHFLFTFSQYLKLSEEYVKENTIFAMSKLISAYTPNLSIEEMKSASQKAMSIDTYNEIEKKFPHIFKGIK